jgi:hypothetical protein
MIPRSEWREGEMLTMTLLLDDRIFPSVCLTGHGKSPSFLKKTQGQRSFSYIGPSVWNDLPFSVRHSDTTAHFKTALKTHLFHKVYHNG